jgi:hypothetical protein
MSMVGRSIPALVGKKRYGFRRRKVMKVGNESFGRGVGRVAQIFLLPVQPSVIYDARVREDAACGVKAGVQEVKGFRQTAPGFSQHQVIAIAQHDSISVSKFVDAIAEVVAQRTICPGPQVRKVQKLFGRCGFPIYIGPR